jgi:hypothetical protein
MESPAAQRLEVSQFVMLHEAVGEDLRCMEAFLHLAMKESARCFI